MANINFLSAVMGQIFFPGGKSTRTVGEKLSDFVNIMDFGAVRNDSSAGAQANNNLAWTAAQNYLADAGNDGGTIYFPHGHFYFANTMVTTAGGRYTIKGAGTADSGAGLTYTTGSQSGTCLVFPNTNCIGLMMKTNRGPHVLEDFWVVGSHVGGGGADPGANTASGILINNTTYINRVGVRGFPGHGILFHGNSAGEGTNCNESSAHNCTLKGNGGCGLKTEGSDANACFFSMLNCADNRLFSVWDDSKFQNVHIGHHHSAGSFARGSYKDSSDSGAVWINLYTENAGSPHAEWTNQSVILGPSADTLPKASVQGDGSGATLLLWTRGGAVTKGLPTAYGSGYTQANVIITHGSGNNAVLTPVITNGQILSYNIANGGSGYSHAPSHRTIRYNKFRELGSQATFYTEADDGPGRYIRLTIGDKRSANEISVLKGKALGEEDFDFLWWNESTKCWELVWNRFTKVIRWVGTLSTTETGGRSSTLPPGSMEFPFGFFVGSGSTGRHLNNKSSIPTSGEYARGDLIWNTSPAIDANNNVVLGWHRTVTGTAHVKGTDWAELLVPTKRLGGTVTVNPESLGSGAKGNSATLTITGAALGDIVSSSFSLDLQGVDLKGYVSAANTVTYYFKNDTTGTVDLGSGTAKFRIDK
jgi:hypothetical protein